VRGPAGLLRRARSRGRFVLPTVGLAVAALAAAVAFAAPGDLITARDSDDSPVLLDVGSVSLVQPRATRIEARVTMNEDWNPGTMLASSGPPGSICVHLWTTRRPGSQPPNYLVCGTPQTARRLRVGVFRENGDGLPVKTDAAGATISGRTLIMRFTPASIGSPDSLRFSAEATQLTGCPRPRGCFDRGPNGARTASFQLR
jgi:hypothetical protein